MNGTDTNYLSGFPSQVVPFEEKNSWEYGLKVARAIENEWFSNNRYGAATTRTGLYQTNYAEYHNRRLYARGEQSIQKYKDELSINGDLSYLNLDWKPVPIISKFVDIVVNGLADRNYEIKAFSQDPESLRKRTQYATDLMRDMMMQEYLVKAQEQLGMDLYASGEKGNLPENTEELELHMQLSYKQSVEIAEEEAISNVLDENKYDQIKKRLIQDLVVCGISCVKTNFNDSQGITVEYVDPSNLVYSYTTDPNFDDLYYVGEYKMVTLPEIAKQFPNLSDSELKKIQEYQGNRTYMYGYGNGPNDENTIPVLYFEYKTYMDQVFKIKQTEQGLIKAIEKPDTFNPPENENFERVGRTIEVLYKGVKVLGTDMLLKWEMCKNMTRPFADTTKVEMNYLRNWNEAPDVVAVMFFEYRTYMDQVFKIKRTDQGLEKALEKPDTFSPPDTDNFERVGRTIEVLFEGAKVLGINEMIRWEMSSNMTRPFADNTKVRMN